MFNLETAKKSQLVDIVTHLQDTRGCEGDDLWASNLARAKVAKLAARIVTLLGTDLTLSDDGGVVPVGAEPPPGNQESDAPAANPVLTAFVAWHAAGGEGEFTFPGSVTLGTIRAIAALVGKPAKTPGTTRALHPDDGVITLIAEATGKRDGSASHARYSLLRSGMTVAQYVAAAGPRGRRTLRKAIAAGQVRVDPAKGA